VKPKLAAEPHLQNHQEKRLRLELEKMSLRVRRKGTWKHGASLRLREALLVRRTRSIEFERAA